MSQIQSSAKHLNLRAQVVKTLVAVQNGQSLTSVLNQHAVYHFVYLCVDSYYVELY